MVRSVFFVGFCLKCLVKKITLKKFLGPGKIISDARPYASFVFLTSLSFSGDDS